jgi:hypothetical protein
VQQIGPEGGQTYVWKADRRLASCAVAAVLLAISAINSNLPDGFYTFLRIYVSGVAAVLAIYEWRLGRVWLPLSAALIAILFNPIRPIEMNDATSWQPYDWGAAAWFVVVAATPAVRFYRVPMKGWVAASVAVVVLSLLGVGVRTTNFDVANNTMNVNENLTVTDMNATDVNAATAGESAISVLDVGHPSAPLPDFLKEITNTIAENTESVPTAIQPNTAAAVTAAAPIGGSIFNAAPSQSQSNDEAEIAGDNDTDADTNQ